MEDISEYLFPVENNEEVFYVSIRLNHMLKVVQDLILIMIEKTQLPNIKLWKSGIRSKLMLIPKLKRFWLIRMNSDMPMMDTMVVDDHLTNIIY